MNAPLASPALPLLASLAEDRTTLVVTGSERVGWLNGLVTCDLKKLGDRVGAYGLVVAKNGRIQADIAIVQAGDTLLLSVPRSREEKLLAMFDTYLVMEDAEVSALCAADVRIGVVLRDSRQANATPLSSEAFRPSGCP